MRDPKRHWRAPGLALALLLVSATSLRAEPPADDALAIAAIDLLASHCVPCRDKRDLAMIARDPSLIQPGNPDGSPAYTSLVRGLLTLPSPPTVEQLARLRTWIERLPATAPTKPHVTAQSNTSDADAASIELNIRADRARYKAGDEIRFAIRSNADCRLHVISIDVAGHGTVIFPNDFAPDDRISANTNLALPAPGAGYRFRVKEKGRERVVALCTRASGAIDGITHDFERQRFQELGVYATFLDTALQNAIKRKSEREDDATHAPLHEIWRTGIVIDVE